MTDVPRSRATAIHVYFTKSDPRAFKFTLNAIYLALQYGGCAERRVLVGHRRSEYTWPHSRPILGCLMQRGCGLTANGGTPTRRSGHQAEHNKNLTLGCRDKVTVASLYQRLPPQDRPSQRLETRTKYRLSPYTYPQCLRRMHPFQSSLRPGLSRRRAAAPTIGVLRGVIEREATARRGLWAIPRKPGGSREVEVH